MPPEQILDAKTLDKLGKIWRLRQSTTFAGEIANAERKAAILVAKFGCSLHDVERLLADQGGFHPDARQQAKTRREQQDAKRREQDAEKRRQQEAEEQRRQAAKERDRQQAEEQRRQAAKERDRQQAEEQRRQDGEKRRQLALEREKVIRRYGSVQAAKAWQPHEVLLHEAVKAFFDIDKNDGGRVRSIDGWHGGYYEKPPKRAVDLVSEAYPLPTSISEAKIELDYWNEREKDLYFLFEENSLRKLTLPALLRSKIVEELFATTIRAQSISETILRQRYSLEIGTNVIQQAVLRDLEHLAATKSPANDQRPVDTSENLRRTSTKERRLAVERLLSSADANSLSDREISRRVGVSPQTVGNIRRRLTSEMPSRTGMNDRRKPSSMSDR